MLSDLLSLLEGYLPVADPSLPTPNVSVVRVTERPVGLGNWVGNEMRGAFAVTELKGSRLDATIRFQVWAAQPTDADRAIADLLDRLLADKPILRSLGLLKLAIAETSLTAFDSALNIWQKTTDCTVLYESQFQNPEGAQSLIARIPITIDEPFREVTVVTNGMVRWDDQSAPKLVVRGRSQVSRLSILAFIPSKTPTGDIVITRTFNGASGTPTVYRTLAAFRRDVAGFNPANRHAQVSFTSLNPFMAEFNSAGDAVELGDWNDDGVPDVYESKLLTFEPAIQLPSTRDRLEIAYQGSFLNQVAVVYLRVN